MTLLYEIVIIHLHLFRCKTKKREIEGNDFSGIMKTDKNTSLQLITEIDWNNPTEKPKRETKTVLAVLAVVLVLIVLVGLCLAFNFDGLYRQ